MWIDRKCREYLEGAWAYGLKTKLRENPYLARAETKKWDHWKRGWLNAQEARRYARIPLPANTCRNCRQGSDVTTV